MIEAVCGVAITIAVLCLALLAWIATQLFRIEKSQQKFELQTSSDLHNAKKAFLGMHERMKELEANALPPTGIYEMKTDKQTGRQRWDFRQDLPANFRPETDLDDLLETADKLANGRT
jgi:hypothetical protein